MHFKAQTQDQLISRFKPQSISNFYASTVVKPLAYASLLAAPYVSYKIAEKIAPQREKELLTKGTISVSPWWYTASPFTSTALASLYGGYTGGLTWAAIYGGLAALLNTPALLYARRCMQQELVTKKTIQDETEYAHKKIGLALSSNDPNTVPYIENILSEASQPHVYTNSHVYTNLSKKINDEALKLHQLIVDPSNNETITKTLNAMPPENAEFIIMHQVDESKETLLHAALYHNNLKIVTFLVKKTDKRILLLSDKKAQTPKKILETIKGNNQNPNYDEASKLHKEYFGPKVVSDEGCKVQ